MEIRHPIRVLEFYSGIGGMRFSLKAAKVDSVVVEAFEINDIANDVYEFNFKHRPNQGNIQRLSVDDLDKYKANAWLLSPPCQPFTRQGLQKDSADGRTSSFLQLLEKLSDMCNQPTYMFIENVVGFEHSLTHRCLMGVLKENNFMVQEFILTPLQYGIPYSRPRYFCLAKKQHLSFRHPMLNGLILLRPLHKEHKLITAELLESSKACRDESFGSDKGKPNEPVLDPTTSCECINHFLEKDQREIVPKHQSTEDKSCSQEWESYVVPHKLIQRWADVFDIVTPSSKRCCCFTKSYGRYVKGTGSFLATRMPEKVSEKEVSSKCEDIMRSDLGLRYFTPQEIANLHSFPQEFRFPDHVSIKQRYALLGNSLSISVVSSLLEYLFLDCNDIL